MLVDNDNWRDADNAQEIIDTTIAPTEERESAALRELDPGAFTVVVAGADDGTGIGLIEIYDWIWLEDRSS